MELLAKAVSRTLYTQQKLVTICHLENRVLGCAVCGCPLDLVRIIIVRESGLWERGYNVPIAREDLSYSKMRSVPEIGHVGVRAAIVMVWIGG